MFGVPPCKLQKGIFETESEHFEDIILSDISSNISGSLSIYS